MSMGTALGKQLLISYLLTVFTEVPCGFLWKLRSARDFALLVCINTITNPAAVLLDLLLKLCTPPAWRLPEFLVLELAVWAAEALMYRHLIEKIGRPWLYSLQVNLLSIAVGTLVSMFLL